MLLTPENFRNSFLGGLAKLIMGLLVPTDLKKTLKEILWIAFEEHIWLVHKFSVYESKVGSRVLEERL